MTHLRIGRPNGMVMMRDEVLDTLERSLVGER
jgi:hypothetical protein